MTNKYAGKGYMGKILRVNLTEGKFSEEEPSDELVKNYIGGRGWGIKMLYDELEPKIDPLGPENKMIFLTGPLTGTTAQSFARLIVAFKSPLTGIYYRSSAGGAFAPEIKSAGLDAIIVEGKAKKPVYLWINDGKYEIKDATKFWGLDTVATQEKVKKDIDEAKAKVICIGPPGEKLVKISGMATDRRTASRAGGGAVMGSKNLKAIAIRGTNKVEVAMPDLYKIIAGAQVGAYNASAPVMGPGGFTDTGTRLLPFTNALGMYPTRNFREGVLLEWPKLSAEEYMKIKVRSTGCHGCMIHCGSIDRVESGKYAGLEDEGPEYETIWAASGTIDVADIGLTEAMEKFCDDMAIDTISAGSAIAFAYELYEKGIITKEDTDGLELKYGDADVAMELLKKIANKEGFGAILAEGTLRAAQKIGKGAEKYAMQVKGLELPAYDPRGAKAHGLSMLTSNIGGSHCVGYSPQELFNIPLPRPVDPVAIEGKGRLTKYNQDATAVDETGIGCVFPICFFNITPGFYSKFLPPLTGVMEFGDPNYLWKVGERIWNLERMFAVREGMSRKDDNYPDRIKYEVLPSGPAANQVFEQEQLLDEYYEVRGWDVKTGIPTKDKLKELNLDFAAKYGA